MDSVSAFASLAVPRYWHALLLQEAASDPVLARPRWLMPSAHPVPISQAGGIHEARVRLWRYMAVPDYLDAPLRWQEGGHRE